MAIYDPMGLAAAFAQLFSLDTVHIAHLFVQELSALGETVFGRAASR